MYSKIKGQEKAISILKRAIEQDKVANSYLFYGPEGVGKFTTALYFGMALNCHATIDKRPCGLCVSCHKFLSFSHPDFVYTFPSPNWHSDDGKIKSEADLNEFFAYIANKIKSPWKEYFFKGKIEIRIASIRMIIQKINLSPNEGRKKIYIIENADMMNIKTANAFLKTLEEPPEDSVIILTSSKPDSLLSTILSRCQKIQFFPITRQIIEKELIEEKFIENIEAKMYARIANGNMAKALRLVDEGRLETREKTYELLKIMLAQDDLLFIEFANNYRTLKTQSELADIISHLIILLSDISYFQNYPSEIVNLDKTEMLEILHRLNPNVDEYVLKLIDFLEQMLRRLAGNVNPQLILTEIYNRLNQTFFR